MDVAPLAHARITKKMFAAEAPELRLRHRLELAVIRLPDVEQREKIRIRMHEAPVGRIGLLLFVHRPLTRVLDAQAGGDDHDFAQCLLGARLQNHAPHGRIDGQPREFAADGRELIDVGRGLLTPPLGRRNDFDGRRWFRRRNFFGGVGRPRPTIFNRPQLLQQRVARADGFSGGHVDEREALNVAEAERLQAQDDVGEIRPLDLRLREARALQKILFGIKPDAHAFRHATAAPLPLVGARLRDGLDRQPARARLRRVATQAREARVHDETDAGDRKRGLGDIRREDDFSPLRRREHALLLDVRKPAEHRDHLAVDQPPAAEQVAEFADVALAREKHQHVAARALAHDALHGLDRAIDVVERLGARLAFVALGGIGAEFIQRRVDDFDRIGAALDLNDRRIVERFAESLRVDRRRGDDDF